MHGREKKLNRFHNSTQNTISQTNIQYRTLPVFQINTNVTVTVVTTLAQHGLTDVELVT